MSILSDIISMFNAAIIIFRCDTEKYFYNLGQAMCPEAINYAKREASKN